MKIPVGKASRLRLYTLGVFFLFLVASSSVAAAGIASYQHKEIQEEIANYKVFFDFEDPIVLFFDPTNHELSHLANNLFNSLSMIYQETRMFPVTSEDLLESSLEREQPWIAVYLLHTNLTGVKFYPYGAILGPILPG